MYPRLIQQQVREALADTPVVLIVGPRRAGKTTLVRGLRQDGRTYLTLDDQTSLDAARSDPVGFVRGLDRAAIDEIQRVPELLLAIKKAVDEDQRAGHFLLTGSANILTLPRVADSLAGRMETIRLLPLSHAEVISGRSTFLADLLVGRLPKPQHIVLGDDLIQIVLAGGYPEAISRANERRRQSWFRSYLTSVLTRDLRDIAEVEKLAELPRFVRLLAEHSGQLVNYSTFAGGIGVSYKTTQRYIGLLEQLFLVATLPPWYTNAVKRIVKTPKLHFVDSGILAVNRSMSFARAKADRSAFGALLEGFVFAEVSKLATWSDSPLSLFHFRDPEGREVDIVLEADDGTVAGIEIKANATVTPADFAGLRKLAQAAARRFAFGVVLYDGDTVVPFGERLAAAPLSCLWS
ncbi:MAG: ATP-binding protein [Reyranellaceae bacterium]